MSNFHQSRVAASRSHWQEPGDSAGSSADAGAESLESLYETQHSPSDSGNEHVSTHELRVFWCVRLAHLCGVHAGTSTECGNGSADHTPRTGDLAKKWVAVRESRDTGTVGDIVSHAREDDNCAYEHAN